MLREASRQRSGSMVGLHNYPNEKLKTNDGLIKKDMTHTILNIAGPQKHLQPAHILSLLIGINF